MITSARDTDTFRNDLSLSGGTSSIVVGSVLLGIDGMPSSSLWEDGGWGSGLCPLRLSLSGRLFIPVSFLQM